MFLSGQKNKEITFSEGYIISIAMSAAVLSILILFLLFSIPFYECKGSFFYFK